MQQINAVYNGYLITSDKSVLDVHAAHKWLSEESYWCPGISFENVQTSFEHSFCFGVLDDKRQIAYGRLITDYASFGYLADVYVLNEYRGQGISKAMIKALVELPWVKELRAIMLGTRDAHGLYQQFGFCELPEPGRYMKLSKQ